MRKTSWEIDHKQCPKCGKEMYRKSEMCRECWKKSDKPPYKRNPLRGTEHPLWKGDAARKETKHKRARGLYPHIGICEECNQNRATERHHIDKDEGNNRRDNVMFLCHRCHMKIDGRLSAFMAHSASLRGVQPPKQCINCRRPQKPLRNGRCHSCNEYLRRRGRERPYIHDGRKEKFVHA